MTVSTPRTNPVMATLLCGDIPLFVILFLSEPKRSFSRLTPALSAVLPVDVYSFSAYNQYEAESSRYLIR